MEIIKDGDKERARRKRLDKRRFLCNDCGCVFVATNEEYAWGDPRDLVPYCTCPCCGKKFVESTGRA